jgi:hypothetical protein
MGNTRGDDMAKKSGYSKKKPVNDKAVSGNKRQFNMRDYHGKKIKKG